MLKKTNIFVVLLSSIIFLSCKERHFLPRNSHVFAKHIVFDEKISVSLIDTLEVYESSLPRGFRRQIRINKKIYQSEFTFTLYRDGTLYQKYNYGQIPKLYQKLGINPIGINSETIGENFLVRILKNDKIIDGLDTLNIVEIFTKEKLVLVEPQKYKDRIILYEYKIGNDSIQKTPE